MAGLPRGDAPADLRLSRLHALLGPQSHRESEAQAQDVEKALASRAGGDRCLAPSGTEHTETSRPLAGSGWQDTRPSHRLWGDRQQPRPAAIPDGGATLTLYVAQPPEPETQLHLGRVLALCSAIPSPTAHALGAPHPEVVKDCMQRRVRVVPQAGLC